MGLRTKGVLFFMTIPGNFIKSIFYEKNFLAAARKYEVEKRTHKKKILFVEFWRKSF